VFVFSSSLAVFGSDPTGSPVGTVDDNTLPRPQSSYGVQKFISEQLVADYTRRGFVRGRSVRLMTVAVRPGRPNAAMSSFMSGIIREPLAGQHVTCPVPPDTPLALSSPRRTLDGIMRAAEIGDAEWGSRTAMNLPALSTTPREMGAALDRVAGPGSSALIDWAVDPAITAILQTWPARFVTARAERLGLIADRSFDDIIREYITDNLPVSQVRSVAGEHLPRRRTDRRHSPAGLRGCGSMDREEPARRRNRPLAIVTAAAESGAMPCSSPGPGSGEGRRVIASALAALLTGRWVIPRPVPSWRRRETASTRCAGYRR
jgi:hypothetical protein